MLCLFDSTFIRFDLEHHLLDMNFERLHRREVNMSLNMHGTQYGLSHIITKFYKTLKLNWLCSKMSKCNVNWATSRYIALP